MPARAAAPGQEGSAAGSSPSPCQSVFDHGSLIAFHANERTVEGAGGGASHKRSTSVPEVRHFFEVLGSDLRWHGAPSADVILDNGGRFSSTSTRASSSLRTRMPLGSIWSARCWSWPSAATQHHNPKANRMSAPTSCSSPCLAQRSTAEDGMASSPNYSIRAEVPSTTTTPVRSSRP
jgi:hypothetical protein